MLPSVRCWPLLLRLPVSTGVVFVFLSDCVCLSLWKATEQWYEIQDLHVQETMPQLIGVSESYMMIYERKQ